MISIRRSWSALLLTCVASLLGAAADAAPAKTKIALLPLEGRDGVNPVLTEVMTEALAAELMSRPNLSVITPKDIEAALGFEKKKAKINAEVAAQSGNDVCTDTSCLQEIGGALGVDLTVSGTISRLGSSWILTVQAFNPRKAEVVKRHFARVASQEPDALLDKVPEVAWELFPNGAQRPQAQSATPPVQSAQAPPAAATAQAPIPSTQSGSILTPYQTPGAMPVRVPGPGEGLTLLKFTFDPGTDPEVVAVKVTTAEGTKECFNISPLNPCKLTVPAGKAQVKVSGAVDLEQSVELPSNQARMAMVTKPPSGGPMLAGGLVAGAIGVAGGYAFLATDVCSDSDSGGLCALSIVGAVGGLSVGVPLTLIGLARVIVTPPPALHVFELWEVPGTASLPKKLLEGTAVSVHPHGGGVSTTVNF